MAPKISSMGKDKDVGDSETKKYKAHCTMSNKKLFIDLALEQARWGLHGRRMR